MLYQTFEGLRSLKIFDQRSIFVFVFGPFQIVEESSKLQRFLAVYPKDIWGEILFCRRNFEAKLMKIGQNWGKIEKTLDIPNFDRCQYHQTILPRNFYLWRSSEIFQNSEESSSSSLVFFLNQKILHLRLQSIFNLCCTTVWTMCIYYRYDPC